MRVGLLELVERAVNDELAELLEPALGLQIAGEGDAVVLALQPEKLVADRLGGDVVARTKLTPQRRHELLLENGAGREQRRIPLPARVDRLEAAVVQLEAEVEGELQVVVAERVADLGAELGRAQSEVG